MVSVGESCFALDFYFVNLEISWNYISLPIFLSLPRSENAVKNRFKSAYIQKLVAEANGGIAPTPPSVSRPAGGVGDNAVGAAAPLGPSSSPSSVQRVVTQAGSGSHVTIVGVQPLGGGIGSGTSSPMPLSSSTVCNTPTVPQPPGESAVVAASVVPITGTESAAAVAAKYGEQSFALHPAPMMGMAPSTENPVVRNKKRARSRPSRSKAAVAQREKERALQSVRDEAAARALLPDDGSHPAVMNEGEAALIRRSYALGFSRGVKSHRKKGGQVHHQHHHATASKGVNAVSGLADVWSEGVQWDFYDPDDELMTEGLEGKKRCLPGSLEHALYEQGVDIDFYATVNEHMQEHHSSTEMMTLPMESSPSYCFE